MHRRLGSLTLLVVTAFLFSGCVDGNDPEEVYTHHWFWGAGNYDTSQLPVFEDTFDVSGDPEELEVQVQWNIATGRAAIVLTPPGGEPMNHTDQETNGPDGEGTFQVTAASGTWDFRIPTWRADDGEFPSGEVQAEILAT